MWWHPTELVIGSGLVWSTHMHTGTYVIHIAHGHLHPPRMQEKAVWSFTGSDLLLKMTHLPYTHMCTQHTHTHCRFIEKKKNPHKGGRGTLEMLPFLKIENVMVGVAGDELCLCQTQRECDQVRGRRAHILLCAHTVLWL